MIVKQRMMVNKLKSFILSSSDELPNIALLVGIRKIGKTTILKQLNDIFPNATYIDFRQPNAWDKFIEFKANPSNLLLIDEITYAEETSDVATMLEMDSNEHGYKVIITGSSPYHLMALYIGNLGGGRSTLYRLSLLSFTEYLYFTDRIASYEDEYISTQQDFQDYLSLKGIPSGLNFTLSEDYLRTMYSEIALSNENSKLVTGIADINEESLISIATLIAYKLNEVTKPSSIFNPTGNREVKYIGGKDTNNLDLGDTILFTQRGITKNLSITDRINVLIFLIKSNLAYVEIKYEDKQRCNVYNLLNDLKHTKNYNDLTQILSDYNISLISPLLYTRIGKDLLQKANLDESLLNTPYLLGLLLEVYVKGINVADQCGVMYTSYKIGSNENQEVDICDLRNNLLCEVTVSNKKSKNIHVLEHFVDDTEIKRVVTTDNIDEYTKGMYKIPYPKFCQLLDKGIIYNLPPTPEDSPPKIQNTDKTE